MLSLQLPLRISLNSVSMVLSSTFATLSEAQVTTDYKSSVAAVQPFSAIPGPKPLPLLRNLLKFRKHFFTLNHYLEECSDKYGEIFKLEAPGRSSAYIVLTMHYLLFEGGNNFVYIANPNALEIILRAEGKYPRRDASISPYIQWILNKQNFAVPLPFKYVHYYAT